ncbi:HlyD family efflux transporter periplasmic adaptor subunit [Stenotrophomonas sp. S48]|nr:HlyD family efflux transporter periplasmic adaptor subunit [Stenotrophomonas sp. S48]MBK0048564.1 HlyD family efflux transporter periplasmic adaptor subunit [Stenotrophomonas sp. S49]
MMFSQGDRVQPGQPLLVLGQKRFLLQGEDVEQGLIHSLQARLDRVDASIVSERTRSKSELDALRERLAVIDQRAKTSEQRIGLLDERSANQKALIAKFEKLIDDRYVSETALVQQRDSLLALNDELFTQKLSIHQLAEERIDVVQRMRDVPLQSASNNERLHQERDQLSDRLLEVRLRSGMQIQSPIEGTVSAVLAGTTDYVEQGQPLMHLYSNLSNLEAVLYVPSASIGLMAVGQPVNVRFAAFPHEKYGVAKGEVTGISRSALREEDRPEIEGLKGPAYQVRVRLPDRDVRLDGHRFPLMPGMIVKAEIEVDRRSLVEWLFAPFKRLRSAG